MELSFSLVAIILSIVSLVWSVHTSKINLYQTKINRNLSLMSDLKLKLSDIPTAFRFYGISEDDIKKHDVTPSELAYLTSNFVAGQIFWETEVGKNGEVFSGSDYRSILCQSKHVQNAWPLIIKMLDDTPYRRNLEEMVLRYSKKF